MTLKTIAFIIVAMLAAALALQGINGQDTPKKPAGFRPMHFGAQLTFASGDNYVSTGELKEQLNAIGETGADVVRIDMDYEAWMTNDTGNIERHDEIIRQIRADGKKLMLADRGAISFKKSPVGWDEFRQHHLKHVRIFAERYQPDYYVAIKEPIWYYKFYGMIKTETTPQLWRDLAEEACRNIKEASPSTRCAVAVYASGEGERDFFALAANITGVDIMGVDVYDDNDIKKTAEGLMPLVPEGKELWMLESWNGGSGSYLRPWKERDDAEWIRKSVYFAQEKGFDGYVAYYPLHFASYTRLRNVDWNKRTLPFYAYKEAIEEVHNATKLTS